MHGPRSGRLSLAPPESTYAQRDDHAYVRDDNTRRAAESTQPQRLPDSVGATSRHTTPRRAAGAPTPPAGASLDGARSRRAISVSP
ncbi:hypothetical protein GCM10020221_22650 [Streptomyces thioluteus]|uniref:Uncharacterized protein n=1 Tax=Streptomyces thioluteus TaxID=66431 RepID=A0ABN3WTZ1_STRTU